METRRGTITKEAAELARLERIRDAAPDLLAACKVSERFMNPDHHGPEDECPTCGSQLIGVHEDDCPLAIVRAAIAKAEGLLPP